MPSMFAEFELPVPAALLACLIPAGTFLGYLAASILMTATSKAV